MDQIKEAFKKVKEDIAFLNNELVSFHKEISEINSKLDSILNQKQELQDTFPSTDKPTDRQTNQSLPTDIPTHNLPFKPLNPQNMPFSTGNGGVPTDRQTNQQTNQQTQNKEKNDQNSMQDALAILNSLDSIKKDIRLKFKRLTEQEFLVFSMIYQLDDELGYTDYKTLSQKLNLSESSVRDYTGKLIKKGIPVEKIKINNKNIQLTISDNLKKIASLSTILQLRGL